MAITLKAFLVFLFAWIATIWPGIWTALLMLVALSAMCLGMALEHHLARRQRSAGRRSQSRMTA